MESFEQTVADLDSLVGRASKHVRFKSRQKYLFFITFFCIMYKDIIQILNDGIITISVKNKMAPCLHKHKSDFKHN